MNLNARPWVVVSSPGKGQEGHHTALQAAPTPHATAHQPSPHPGQGYLKPATGAAASTRRQPASSLPRSGHWAPKLGPKYLPGAH